MAEDGGDTDLEPTSNADDVTSRENRVRKRITDENEHRQQSKCRPRIDVLATPNRRLILDLFQNHAHHLPKTKSENIKKNLQEMYAMTPQETQQYLMHLQKQAEAISKRREMKAMLRRMVKKRKKQHQRAKAYRLLERLLKKGMEYSFNNAVPPLVSVRLRNLSDIVLEQICDLRNIRVPERDNPDRVGLFLIAFADWLAIAIEHLYYGVQLKKNQELQKIEEEEAQRQKTTGTQQKQDTTKSKKDVEDSEAKNEEVLSEVMLSEIE